MAECDFDVELVGEMLSKMLGAIDRTMLASGASETDLKMGELPFDECLDVEIHQ